MTGAVSEARGKSKMLDMETAAYIWHCIRNHEGFAEDLSEWCYNLDIDFDYVGIFNRNVIEMIEQLPLKSEIDSHGGIINE